MRIRSIINISKNLSNGSNVNEIWFIQGLVEHGASIFLEDDQHLSACDIAEQNQHDAIAAYLEAKMVFNVQVSIKC